MMGTARRFWACAVAGIVAAAVSCGGSSDSAGTDHGAASIMLAMGGGVQGGLYGSAPSLNPDPNNPTLENNGADVHYETDFRAVYARVIDNWLGGDSAAVLGGNFRVNGINFI